ncbi:hypothetical protein D3C73_1549140 [compost metagenome]
MLRRFVTLAIVGAIAPRSAMYPVKRPLIVVTGPAEIACTSAPKSPDEVMLTATAASSYW